MNLLRRYRGSYACYVLIYFCSYFAMAAFSSVLSVYLTGIGKSAAEISFIISASSLFSLGIVPVAGYLCDRLGRPRLICSLLMAQMGLVSLAFPAARQVSALFLLNGLGMSFHNATMSFSEKLAAACRYRYGVLRIWGTFGYAAGAQAAGLSLQLFPPMVLFAAIAVFTGLAVLGYLGAEDLPAGQGGEDRGQPVRLSAFLRTPQFLLFLPVSLLFYACSGTNMTFSPVLLRELGVSTGAVGTVLSLSTLVEIPLILFSHKFMDRFSGKTLLAATFVIALGEFLIFGLWRSAAAVTAAMILLKAVASTLFMMVVLKVVRNLVAPELTTTGLSVVNTVNNLGVIALQNLGGSLTDRFDVQALYLLMAGLTAVGLALCFFLKIGNDEKVFG